MGWQIKTKDGKVYGSVDTGTLRKWISEKRILSEDCVWDEDRKKWVIIKSVPEIEYLFNEDINTAKNKEIPEVRISTAKDSSDTLYDDKNILTDQLIADAWRAMLAKGIWSIIGTILLIGIVSWIGMLVSWACVIVGAFISPHLSFIGGVLVLLIIFSSFMLGWSAYLLKIARKEEVSIGSIFEGFKGKYIWRAFGAMLLIAILTTLASFISLGIWGFYLTFAYLLTYFFIFDENRGPWESMKASYDITKGYKWRIVAVQIVCMLLGMLFLGIGLIVTMPLANIAIASLYYRIRTGRISEKHLQTSFPEYLIVLIPFIAVIVLIFATILMKQLPLLLPQIEGYLKSLPIKL